MEPKTHLAFVLLVCASMTGTIRCARLNMGADSGAGERMQNRIDVSLLPPTCSEEIVEETCALVAGTSTKKGTRSGSINVHDIQKILAASNAAVMSFLHALPIDGEKKLPCQQLCTTVMKYLAPYADLPSTVDLGGYRETSGGVAWTVDARPSKVAELGTAGDLPRMHEGAQQAKAGIRVRTSRVAESGSGNTELDTAAKRRDLSSVKGHSARGTGVKYTTLQMAERVANLFRVYPVMHEQGDASSLAERSRNLVNMVANATRLESGPIVTEARIFLDNAIRNVNAAGDSKKIFDRWFGKQTSEEVRQESQENVLATLNSVRQLIGNMHLYKQGPGCEDGVIAYVYPEADTDCTDEEASAGGCTSNERNEFVVYVCKDYFTDSSGSPRPARFQVGTLIHEGSHHATAYTDDICIERARKPCWTCSDDDAPGMKRCTGRAYGRMVCRVLAFNSPKDAMNNADNLEYFATDLGFMAAEDSCPVGATTVKPDSDGDCMCPPHTVCRNSTSAESSLSLTSDPCVRNGHGDNTFFPQTCTSCGCVAGDLTGNDDCADQATCMLFPVECVGQSACIRFGKDGCSAACTPHNVSVRGVSESMCTFEHCAKCSWCLPDAEASTYVMGITGINGCSIGQIADASSCMAAAVQLGYTWGSSEDDNNYPNGCYGLTTSVYFNVHLGAAQSSSTPICQATGMDEGGTKSSFHSFALFVFSLAIGSGLMY